MPDVMHTLKVDLGSRTDDRSYPISIGRGLLSDSAHWQKLVEGRGVVNGPGILAAAGAGGQATHHHIRGLIEGLGGD